VTGQSDLYSLGIVLYEMLTGEVPFKGENQIAVAMKHVREDLPDVQVRRPEVSAALASVVDTATAKRVEDRYADDAELIADLEDVLAIEAARAGGATGEVTSVLRTLPSQTQRRVPFRVRHRVIAVLWLLPALAVIAGVAVWLGTRTHHGAGKLPIKPPVVTHTSKPLTQVQLCDTCAQGYNPLAVPHDENPNAPLAIDNQLGTYWSTQTYYDGKLDKAGTGLYVDANPGTVARVLRVVTSTAGFSATIYASNATPTYVWPNPAWTAVSASTTVARVENIQLTSASKRYRYWLVWITNLGPNHGVKLDEVALYR
jgi:serine/threonine protein kinase